MSIWDKSILDIIGGHSFVAIYPDKDPDIGFPFKMWRPIRWIPIAVMWYNDDSPFWRRFP